MLLISFSPYRLIRITELALMPFKALIWWYTGGIYDLFRFCSYHLWSLEDHFSFRDMLVRIPTLEPLHRDYGSNVTEKIVARGIGVVFRTGWVVVAGLILLTVLGLCILAFAFWIFVPLFLLFELMLTILFLLGIDLTYLHNNIFVILEEYLYNF